MSATAPSLRKTFWVLPAGFLIGLVLLYPALRAFFLSVTHYGLSTGFGTVFAGADNFQRLLSDSRLHGSFIFTGAFVAVSVALEFGLGLGLALATTRLARRQDTARLAWTHVGQDDRGADPYPAGPLATIADTCTL